VTAAAAPQPHLLIIDDEANLCRQLSLFFKSKGYNTLTAYTVAEGYRLFQEYRPSFIICDVRLPDGSGLDVLQRIREVDPGAYLIMITAYQDMNTTITAMQRGAFDYIHKPFDPQELEMVIGKARENQRLHKEVSRLYAERGEPPKSHVLIGKSKAILEIYKTIGIVSESKTLILITGESGTGKELIARAIHENARPQEPFISVNCSALVDTLLESELFGHEKGAFTGADSRHYGKFELAGRGTIFLDEVGDMSPNLQVKVLRVLQEREFMRVGGREIIATEARVIAATNQDLDALVAEGTFREDLYYRLKVITIDVPPLRERKEDIPLLVEHFLRKINRDVHKDVYRVPDEVMAQLVSYDWRGNVRELENVLTRAVVLSKGGVLEMPQELFPRRKALRGEGPVLRDLNEVEAEHILRVLEFVKWHQGKACRVLGISRPTLRKKIREYGLKESSHAGSGFSKPHPG
jgi:two-component system response regulator AtoC